METIVDNKIKVNSSNYEYNRKYIDKYRKKEDNKIEQSIRDKKYRMKMANDEEFIKKGKERKQRYNERERLKRIESFKLELNNLNMTNPNDYDRYCKISTAIIRAVAYSKLYNESLEASKILIKEE